MQTTGGIARTAANLARLLALLAALTVVLNLSAAHAHPGAGSLSQGDLSHDLPSQGDLSQGDLSQGDRQADCGEHGAPHLPSAAGDCGHHFHPLVRAPGLVLPADPIALAAPREAGPSQQIFHSFDPPPPRRPA